MGNYIREKWNNRKTEWLKRRLAAWLCVVLAVQTMVSGWSPAAAFAQGGQEYEEQDGGSEDERMTLAGRVIFRGTDMDIRRDVKLRLYVNGELSEKYKPVFARSEDTREDFWDEDSVELINDLEGSEPEDPAAGQESWKASPSDYYGGRATGSNASYDVWEYRFEDLPRYDKNGDEYEYEIADLTYSTATSSNALFCTDMQGSEVVGEGAGPFEASGARLVYVPWTNLEGAYVFEKNGRQEGDPEAVTLDVFTRKEADEEFLTGESPEADPAAGVWALPHVLQYNPLTCEPIIYQIEALTGNENYEIIYQNRGAYQGISDFACDGGTILHRGEGPRTFAVSGTLRWEDQDDRYGLRPETADFLRVLDSDGDDVTGQVEIRTDRIEDGEAGADIWTFEISGLSSEETYRLSQQLKGYAADEMAELTFDESVTELPEATERLAADRTVRGLIRWNGYNPAAAGTDTLDFLHVYAGSQEVTDAVSLEKTGEDTGEAIWTYAVSGLVEGVDYRIVVDEVPGYLVETEQVEIPSVEKAVFSRSPMVGMIPEIRLYARTMGALTIKNVSYGSDNMNWQPVTYTVEVKQDGTYQPYGGENGTITVMPNDDAGITLSLPVGAEYKITQSPVSGAIIYGGTEEAERTGTVLSGTSGDGNTVTFINIATTIADFQKIWNDNNNAGGNRLDEIGENGLDTYLHLVVKLTVGEDDTQEIWVDTETGRQVNPVTGGPEDEEESGSYKDELEKLGFEGKTITCNPSGTSSQGENYWPIHCDSIPMTDEIGNKLEYTMIEIPVPGYGTTYRDGDSNYLRYIMNTSYTSFTADKKWLDNGDKYETRPNEATYAKKLTLYRQNGSSTESQADPVELQMENKEQDAYLEITPDEVDSNTWHLTISNLIQFDETGLPYTYYLKEVSEKGLMEDPDGDPIAAGWKVSPEEDVILEYHGAYENVENYFSITDSCYTKGTITNTLVGETDFHFKKIWVDKATEKNRPDVTFLLMRYPDKAGADYRQASPVAEFTVAGNGWNSEVMADGGYPFRFPADEDEMLPRFDVDGQEYIYFVWESLSGTNSSLYKQEIGNVDLWKDFTDKAMVGNDGTVTNRLSGTVDLPVTKTWVSAAYQDIDAKVVLGVERKLEDGSSDWENVKFTTEQPFITGFSAETITQSTVISGLPRYNDEGYEWTYRVVENDIQMKTEETNGTYVSLEPVDAEAAITDAIPGVNEDDQVYKTTKQHFKDIQYYYISRPEKIVDGGTKITNTLTGKICVQVKKVWDGDWTGKTMPAQLEFTLYRDGEPYPDANKPLTKTLKVPETKNSWLEMTEAERTASFGELPRYDENGYEYVYTVEESFPDNDGSLVGKIDYRYETLPGKWGDDGITKATDIRQAVVTNYPPGSGKTIWVRKEWKDGGDVRHRKPVTARLYTKGEGNSWTAVPRTNRAVTLDESNNWTDEISISGLLHAEDPDYMEYFMIIEESVGKDASAGENADYYPVQYDTQDGVEPYSSGTVTTNYHRYQVSNRWDETKKEWVIENLRIGTLDVEVAKTWKDGGTGTDSSTRPTSAVFRLNQNGQKLYEKNLDSSSTTENTSQTITWTSLPKYDENGALYTYSVEEIQIGGTTVESGAATVTVNINGAAVTHRYVPEISDGSYTHGNEVDDDDSKRSDTISYAATNRRQEMITQPILHKIWKDDGVKAERPDIYLVLYQMAEGGTEPQPVSTYVNYRKLTGSGIKNSDYHEVYQFDPLPRYDDEGRELTYYVKEGMHVNSSGYVPHCYSQAPETDTGEFTMAGKTEYCLNGATEPTGFVPVGGTIVNIREQGVTINGEKIWKLSDGRRLETNYPAVLLRLQSREKRGAEQAYQDVIRDENANGETAPDSRYYQTKLSASDDPDGNSGGTYSFTYKDPDNAGNQLFPKYDPETGRELEYYVKELEVTNYELDNYTRTSNERDFVLVNTYNGTGDLQVSVDKIWEYHNTLTYDKDGTQTEYGYPTIEMRLDRYMQDAAGDPINSTFEKDVKNGNWIKWIESGANREPKVFAFTGLPVYAPNGRKYLYTVEETTINGQTLTGEGEIRGYTVTKTGLATKSDVEEIYQIINIYNPQNGGLIEIKGTKTWNDQSDLYKLRPSIAELNGDSSPITLTLWRKTGDTNSTKVPGAKAVWSEVTGNARQMQFIFTTAENNGVFPRYAPDGKEFQYWVQETIDPDSPLAKIYSLGQTNGNSGSLTAAQLSGTGQLSLTNILNTVSVTANKIWDDHANVYLTRPTGITVQLQRKAVSETKDSAWKPYPTDETADRTIEQSNNWQITVNNLPRYGYSTDRKSAIEYEYRLMEVSEPTGYTHNSGNETDYDYTRNTADGNSTVTLTNHLIRKTEESVQISLEKRWNDENDRDGIRPDSIEVELSRKAKGTNQVATLISTYTIYKDPSKASNSSEVTYGVWTATWSNLPRYMPQDESQQNNEPAEAPVEAEYLLKETGTAGMPYQSHAAHETSGSTDIWIITNTYEPKRMSIEAKKVWAGDRDYPDRYAGQDGAVITYQLYQKPENGSNETLLPDQEKKAGAAENWTATWSNLPVRENGSPIIYTVKEKAVQDYDTTYELLEDGSVTGGQTSGNDPDGISVKGSIDEASYMGANHNVIQVTNKLNKRTKAYVEKTWSQGGILPNLADWTKTESATFVLQRHYLTENGGWIDVTRGQAGLMENPTDNYTLLISHNDTARKTVENLPACDENGRLYQYRFLETGITINTESGSPKWVPAVGKDENTPTEGIVGNYGYVCEAPTEVRTETLAGTGGYLTKVTNTWQTRSFHAVKIWEDDGNRDGLRRPIRLELYANGIPTGLYKTLDPADAEGSADPSRQTVFWEDLPVYAVSSQTPILYRAEEVPGEKGEAAVPDGYQAATGSNASLGSGAAGSVGSSADDPYEITNTHEPERTSYRIRKVWVGDEDWKQDGSTRPESVTVQLWRKAVETRQNASGQEEPVLNAPVLDEVVLDETVPENDVPMEAVLDESVNWEHEWTNLHRYVRHEQKTYEWIYYVKEVSQFEGYAPVASQSDANALENHLKTTDLTVKKQWEDLDDYYGYRPSAITVTLLRKELGDPDWTAFTEQTLELSKQDQWTAVSFDGLPTYSRNNRPYLYRAMETAMDGEPVTGSRAGGYVVSSEEISEQMPFETVITNRLELADVSGTKTWLDEEDAWSTRPDGLELTLKTEPADAFGGTEPFRKQPVWEKTGSQWNWTWNDLPKYARDGVTQIRYQVEERAVPEHYEMTDTDGLRITNTLETGILEVEKIQKGGTVTDFLFTVKAALDGKTWTYQRTIQGGQKFQMTLPAGASYEVFEQEATGYRLTEKTGAAGVIEKDKTSSAVFVNEKIAEETENNENGGNSGDGEEGGNGDGDGNDGNGGSGSSGNGGSGSGGSGSGSTSGVTQPANPGPGVTPEAQTPETQNPEAETPEGTGIGAGTDGSSSVDITQLPEIPTGADNRPVIPAGSIVEILDSNNPDAPPLYHGVYDEEKGFSGLAPGTYQLVLLDENGVPTGMLTVTIDEEGVPRALPKTGDGSIPLAVLAAALIGSAAGIWLLTRRRKEEE